MCMKRVLSAMVFAVIFLNAASAETEAERIESAASVMNEIMATPDKGIPGEILGSAKCVAGVASRAEGGFGFGGAPGKGGGNRRTAGGVSAPAPFPLPRCSLGRQN